MLKSTKIIGLNFDTYSALSLVPRGENLLQQDKPKLYIVVLIEGDDAFTKTRQALSEVEDLFYASSEPVAKKLQESLDTIKLLLRESESPQVLLAATSDDTNGAVLYLLGQGEDLEANLYRHNRVNSLYQASNEPQLVSGLLQPGDRVVLTTQSLKDLLGTNWQKFISLPAGELEDEVATLLSEDQNQPVAAVFIDQEAEVVIEEVIENPFALDHQDQTLISKKLALHQLLRYKKLLIFPIIIIILGFAGFGVYTKFQNQGQPVVTQNSTPAEEESKKVFTVKDFPLWLDLNLVKKDFNTKELSLSHGNILIQDVDKKVVVKINLENKSQQILSGGDKLGEITNSSLNGDVAWVLSKDKGLTRMEGALDPSLVIKTDPEWGNIVDIYGFAGNIYLMDEGNPPAGGQIWKYLPVVAGFSEKRNYFRDDTKVDLVGAKKLQIDSSVWILKGSEILKFTQGASDFFSLSGLEKPLKDIKNFFVSDDTENVYILEGNQLVVVDKKGAYQALYQLDQLMDVLDLVVDEKGKKVYLLSGSKIFSLELK